MDTPPGIIYPYYGVHLYEPLRQESDFAAAIQLPLEENSLVVPNSLFMDPMYYSAFERELPREFVVPLDHHLLPRMLAFSSYVAIISYDDYDY